MLSTIAVLFGGRIAEEMFMNQMTTGASNDFERATSMARDMVTRYGMSDLLGPMVYAENEGEIFLGRSVTKTTNVSEETMRKVDAEIRRIIDEQYAVARKILEDQPRQGRGDGQGAARMGDHRRRPDRRHHVGSSAASAQGALRRQRQRRGATRSTPTAVRPLRRRAGSQPDAQCAPALIRSGRGVLPVPS